MVPVLRGSSPQEGDPLGIYPGGGLDPRIDPALVPEARAQLRDEVRLLTTQLDILVLEQVPHIVMHEHVGEEAPGSES